MTWQADHHSLASRIARPSLAVRLNDFLFSRASLFFSLLFSSSLLSFFRSSLCAVEAGVRLPISIILASHSESVCCKECCLRKGTKEPKEESAASQLPSNTCPAFFLWDHSRRSRLPAHGPRSRAATTLAARGVRQEGASQGILCCKTRKGVTSDPQALLWDLDCSFPFRSPQVI